VDLRVLRYLVAVVDCGSVTQAAAHLRVAQPSLSRQLRALERNLGIELFRHGPGNRLLLSAAGERFIPIARDLVLRADQAALAAGSIAAGQVERITIAAPAVTISDVIAPYVARGHPLDPLIDVWEETPQSADDALQRGADVVILSGVPSQNHAWQAIARLPLFAYVPAGHRWHNDQVVTVGELVKEPLAVLTRHHGTRRLLDQALADAGTTYDVKLECESPQMAQALAAIGTAIAVVSDDARFGLHGLLIEGPSGILRIPLHAEWHRDHFATEVIRGLMRRLTDFCEERYGKPSAADRCEASAVASGFRAPARAASTEAFQA